MKKGLKTLLALMMLVSVSACSKSTSTQETSVKMKKGLKTLLALMMLVSVSACSKSTSTQETSVANVTDGTYVGTSVGMQGDLSVELVVEGGKITTATVTQTSETPSIARVALERLPQQIVEHQTTDLDTVTGATLASNAIMRAAKDAALSCFGKITSTNR